MRTLQEIFDFVVDFLAKQGGRSIVLDVNNARRLTPDDCLYRSPDGRKCGIGCLIPDDKYKPRFEGKSVIEYTILKAAGFDLENKDFANELQGAHDRAESLVDVKYRFSSLASRYSLEPKSVEKFTVWEDKASGGERQVT